jgi:hypothetical protein
VAPEGLTSASSEPTLHLHRLNLVFEAVNDFDLPAFRGSMWRSVLGLALRWLSHATDVDALWPREVVRCPLGPGPRQRLCATLFSPAGPGGRLEGIPRRPSSSRHRRDRNAAGPATLRCWNCP